MGDSIRPADLEERIRRGTAPPVIDVRRAADFDADDGMIPGALRDEPALEPGAAVVVYCARGGSVSRGAAEALRARGLDARFLEGGIAAWRDAGFGTTPKPARRIP